MALCRSNSRTGWICELDLGHGGDHACGAPYRDRADGADHRWSEGNDPVMAERNGVFSDLMDGLTQAEIAGLRELAPSRVAWHVRELRAEELW
jgi:hypothetical protein